MAKGAELAGTGICSGEGGMLPEEQAGNTRYLYDSGADYIILDGRVGGTGAAPEIFRDHISVPSIPALARARHFLDEQGASGRVTLIVTGGLRVPVDFVKAMALGADGVAIANSAMQAIGCVAARMCNSNNCPAGIATQKPELRKRLDTQEAPLRLQRFLESSVELMSVMARACGRQHLGEFATEDLATWHYDLARMSGIRFSGLGR